jgi:hypothetical protein
MKMFALASFLLLTAVPVLSQQRKDQYYGPTGETLVTQCRNITILEPSRKGNATLLTRCLDYITGVVDGATMITDKNPAEFPACLPTSATVGDFAHVVMTFSDTHPEYKKKVATSLILAALENAYPCKAASPSR